MCAGINRRVCRWMKVLPSEGLATHTGLESCIDNCKVMGEALTKGCIGWV
jgi:hypothetical protein